MTTRPFLKPTALRCNHYRLVASSAAAAVSLTAALVVGAGSTALASTKTIRFTVSQVSAPEYKLLQSYVKAFEAHNPGITVDLTEIPFASYDSTIETQIRGGAGPDLMAVNFVDLGTWHSAGYLANVLPLMKKSGWNPSSFNPFYKDGTIAGGQWGIPIDNDVRALYYNAKIFSQYHLQPPRTWQQLPGLCKTLHSHGVYCLSLDTNSNWSAVWEVLGDLQLANGGRILNPSGSKAIAGQSPGTVAAYTLLLKTLRPYYPPGISSMSDQVNATLLEKGKLALQEDGPWNVPVLEAAHMAYGKEFGIIPLPVSTLTHKTMSAGGGWFLGINAKSQNTALAWRLLTFLVGPSDINITSNMANIYGGFPVWKGMAQKSSIWKEPVYKVFVDQLGTAKSPVTPLVPALGQVVTFLWHQIQGILDGTTTVKAGLSTFDQQATGVLAAGG